MNKRIPDVTATSLALRLNTTDQSLHPGCISSSRSNHQLTLKVLITTRTGPSNNRRPTRRLNNQLTDNPRNQKSDPDDNQTNKRPEQSRPRLGLLLRIPGRNHPLDTGIAEDNRRKPATKDGDDERDAAEDAKYLLHTPNIRD